MTNLKEWRKANGLCIDCGDMAKPGCTRCVGCLQVYTVKQKWRVENYSDEKKQRMYDKMKERHAKHMEDPAYVEMLRKRRVEYNRRYRNGY